MDSTGMPGRLDPPPSGMSEADFVARFGGVYEHTPWIARAAYRRGLTRAEDTADGLAAAMASVLAQAGEAEKLALVRAHPDLAGRAAIAGDLTAASRSEQAGAGLDSCTPDEFRRFQQLNDAYRAKFGFPFVLAVAGLSRHDVLEAFAARIDNDLRIELQTALSQIDRIALLRLRALAGRHGAGAAPP